MFAGQFVINSSSYLLRIREQNHTFNDISGGKEILGIFDVRRQLVSLKLQKTHKLIGS